MGIILFDLSEPLEAPIFPPLFLQMKTLEEIATKLGNTAGAEEWKNRADVLLKKLFEHSWTDNGFVAKTSITHNYETNPTSMLIIMPIVLGEYFPDDKFEIIFNYMKNNFLTPLGIATENPNSSKYISDGYWRGPIWEPVTYLLVDGLRRRGEDKFAGDLAKKICELVESAGGSYENYDAISGAGLRDMGFTWTASVALLLLNEYQ